MAKCVVTRGSRCRRAAKWNAGCVPDVADARGEAIEVEGDRARFRVGEAASKMAKHCLAGEKSLRKSAQSGLCDAKSDAPSESFFSRRSTRSHGRRRAVGTCCVIGYDCGVRVVCEKKCAFYRCFFSSACQWIALATSSAGAKPASSLLAAAMPQGRPWKKSFSKVLTP